MWIGIISYKILNSKGEGSLSNLLVALDALVDYQDAHQLKTVVVNMSLGVDTKSTRQNFVDKLITSIAREKNVVFCVASGNEGVNSDMSTPAHTEAVLPVAAYDKENHFTPWSNYGPLVLLCAPGDKIDSTFKDNSYRTLSGTSMATPHVTGAMVLLLKTYPKLNSADAIQKLISRSKKADVTKNPKIKDVPEDTSQLSVYCDRLDQR